MKKLSVRIFSFLLAAAMFSSFASCGKKTQSVEAEPNKPAITAANIEGKRVSLELPLSALSPEDRNDLDGFRDRNGYASVKLNKRTQTVKIVMKELSYDLLKGEIGIEAIKAIYAVENNKRYAYVNKIEEVDKENFTKVVMSVDADKYKKNSLAAKEIGQACLRYQTYDQVENLKAVVEIVDMKTKEVIDTNEFTALAE